MLKIVIFDTRSNPRLTVGQSLFAVYVSGRREDCRHEIKAAPAKQRRAVSLEFVLLGDGAWPAFIGPACVIESDMPAE